MAIFTASQATLAVSTLANTTADSAHALLIARYQDIFDLISTASARGLTSISWNLTKASYLEILTDLQVAGYTVSAWTAGSDLSKSSTITISWPAYAATVYPEISSLTPTSILGNQNVYFSQTFAVTGGTGPYTYSVAGSLPVGLGWSTLANVTTITLSGTPTQLGNLSPGFTISAMDSQGKAFSQAVSWSIGFSSVITITTLAAGTNALSYNPNTGVLTFTPYLLPAASTSTLGSVIVPAVATSGLTNAGGTIGVATATTTQLGAVKVDGSTIQITNGVISIPSGTTVLDKRIRSIAILAAVAFGV